MKVCWDNLERFTYVKNGEFIIDNTKKRYIIKNCKTCNNETLVAKCDYKKGYGKYCDSKCMGKDNDFRNNLSKKQTGKNNSFYGKKHSNKTLQKISLPGNLNSNWKGGISNDPYCSGWKFLTEELKEYDKNKCQNPQCEGKSKRITSHHINYDKQNCHPDNIITLCNSCNVRANGNRDYWQMYYTKLKEKRRRGEILCLI